MRNKKQTKIKDQASHLCFFASSTSLPQILIPVPAHPQQPSRMGNGGCGQSVTAPLCRTFLLTLSPCSEVDPFHELQSFRVKLIQHGSHKSCSSFRAHMPALAWRSPRTVVWVSAPSWCLLHMPQGNISSWSPSSCASDGVHTVVPHSSLLPGTLNVSECMLYQRCCHLG